MFQLGRVRTHLLQRTAAAVLVGHEDLELFGPPEPSSLAESVVPAATTSGGR